MSAPPAGRDSATAPLAPGLFFAGLARLCRQKKNSAPPSAPDNGSDSGAGRCVAGLVTNVHHDDGTGPAGLASTAGDPDRDIEELTLRLHEQQRQILTARLDVLEVLTEISAAVKPERPEELYSLVP